MRQVTTRTLAGIGRLAHRLEALVVLPVVLLIIYLLAGEAMLMASALGLSLAALAGSAIHRVRRSRGGAGRDRVVMRPHLIEALETALADTEGEAGCLVLAIDDFSALTDRHGRSAMEEVTGHLATRLGLLLRMSDCLAQIGQGRIAIVPASNGQFDIDRLVQLALRLQTAVTRAVPLDAGQLHVTCSIGVCLAGHLGAATGDTVLAAAERAAEAAQHEGPGAVRAYHPDMSQDPGTPYPLRRSQLAHALESGEIRAYFQPQLCTATGEVSGVEALARWHHPDRGVLPPSAFLRDIETAGLSPRLAETMLQQGLAALTAWDRAGLTVPSVAVNFSAAELRAPRLTDRIKWELDRFDLTPDRLTVEVLETVVAETDSDVTITNLAALSRLGCGIDLDDFGTGQAAIANIRRFAVRRIKIDRSFVLGIEQDREQQSMVAAILSLADRLSLGAVAEGVETEAALAFLGDLGCGHVQGYAIAHPMPFEQTAAWLASHTVNLRAKETAARAAG